MNLRVTLAGIGLTLLTLLSTAACQRAAPPAPQKPAPAPNEDVEAVENGAVSVAPVSQAPRPVAVAKEARRGDIDWSPVTLQADQASVSCDLDYSAHGDGAPLVELDRETVTATLEPCAERGLLRLRYHGRIDAAFVALVERVAKVADKLAIRKHILDLDSAGGQVEDAMRAGDFIAATRWTVWVREDSICHSSCVFLLSGGDVRRIAGKVGIHRIIRVSSTVTTRAELNAELRVVHERVRDFFERNGTSVAVADLMMAVPNRNLRLLTDDELLRFGVDGVNPAQDDLDRLRLQRECGEDFVARRDSFARAFDRRCRQRDDDLDEINACGLALRRQFGFPDSACPAESPLSEFDLAQADPEPDATAPSADAQAAAESSSPQAAPEAADQHGSD
jgi:hypothetical protein